MWPTETYCGQFWDFCYTGANIAMETVNQVHWSTKYESTNPSIINPHNLLTHWGQDKMAAVSQTTISNVFFNENTRMSIEISLKFIHKGSINSIPALVQIMAWCRLGDRPLSEPMLVCSPTHICDFRPQFSESIDSDICATAHKSHFNLFALACYLCIQTDVTWPFIYMLIYDRHQHLFRAGSHTFPYQK